MRLWLFRLFFETDCPAVRAELDYAVTLRVAHLIGENAGATFDGQCIAKKIEFSIENIVAQDQTGARAADKFRADQECFGDPVRLWLFGVVDSDSQLRTIAQII